MLAAPFPYFGGKSKIADMVWERLGAVPNYVEPFFGSGAVLLRRPHKPHIETVNDKDGLVSNFWRAVQKDPEQTAYHADWPVNECDLHARHAWLVGQKGSLQEKLEQMSYTHYSYYVKCRFENRFDKGGGVSKLPGSCGNGLEYLPTVLDKNKRKLPLSFLCYFPSVK